jgi:hypothetical protein
MRIRISDEWIRIREDQNIWILRCRIRNTGLWDYEFTKKSHNYLLKMIFGLNTCQYEDPTFSLRAGRGRAAGFG